MAKAKNQMTEPKTIKSLLEKESIKKRFEAMLGQKAPGFMSSIISATHTNPTLRNAEPVSVISSAAIAASLDLPINPNLGFAYLVPYKNRGNQKPTAQFQMGWKGFVQLAMRSGQYKTMNASEVYEGELIEHNRITGEMKFDLTEKKSDKKEGYVAYFKLLNGFEKYYYMTMEEIESHGKQYSRSYSHKNSQWQQNFDAMAKKTVLKLLLSKYGVLSIDMTRAMDYDQAAIEENGEASYPDNPESQGAPEPYDPAGIIDVIREEEEEPTPAGTSEELYPDEDSQERGQLYTKIEDTMEKIGYKKENIDKYINRLESVPVDGVRSRLEDLKELEKEGK